MIATNSSGYPGKYPGSNMHPSMALKHRGKVNGHLPGLRAYSRTVGKTPCNIDIYALWYYFYVEG
jgi:hypothetical protein